MNKWVTIATFFFSCIAWNISFGQYIIKGKVIDEYTREPLAFVNIQFDNNKLLRTSTDINGKFSHNFTTIPKTLTCSYVGYEKVSLTLDSVNINNPVIIALRELSYPLNEVIVVPRENPANRIIANVIANKSLNNPENITSFKYRSYNKVIYDMDIDDSVLHGSDTGVIEKVFKGGHMMIMESVTERKFVYPDHSEEIVLGSKVSGFKEPSFATLATDVQPFSFYEDIITILDIDYLNPVSQGSLNKYQYTLEDTLVEGVDTTFILSYKPLSGKNFEGLTGLLYINTHKYAIQNVTAEPYEMGFIGIRLQQKYNLVDGKTWFPEQLKFELIFRQDKNQKVAVKASGTSIISNVELYSVPDKGEIGLEAVKMHELANKRDSIFWDESRTITLDDKDKTTYQVMDSLGEKYKFDNKLIVLEKLGQSRIPVGIIDLDISRFINYNHFEGVRLGLGAYTSDKLMRNFTVGGYFGYGIKDNNWKYGVESILILDKEKELKLTARHQNTLQETGKTWLNYFRPRQFDFRSFLASQMDHIRQTSLMIGFRTIKYARINIAFNTARVEPLYHYEFQSDETGPIHNYTNTDITINLRYAFKEKLIESMGQRLSMGTKYPVLSLTYIRGMDGLLNGQFAYNKMEARIEESLYFRNLGESRIRIDAGFIDNPLPYGMLFTGEGSYIRNWSVLIKNSFQTVTPYEFLSDRYMHVHYSHNFGSLLLKIGNWKPGISVFQNLGWGSLKQSESHIGVEFKTKEKGLYESGIQLDNILKVNYLNSSYLGFGAGVYYRYGPYALDAFSENLAFTFSMTFTTK